MDRMENKTYIKKNKPLIFYSVLGIAVCIGLLLEFIAFSYGPLKIIRYLVIAVGLFIISWQDIKERIILNKTLLLLSIIRLAIIILECIVYAQFVISIISSALIGVLFAILVFGGCYLIARGGMGAGDVKLMAIVGFYVGSAVIMQVMLLTVVAAAIYSIVKLIRKKTKLKDEIAFAPFVLIGTVLAFALGV